MRQGSPSTARFAVLPFSLTAPPGIYIVQYISCVYYTIILDYWIAGKSALGTPGPREGITVLHRKLVAVAAATLLVGGPSPAKIEPLGIVTHAERAHLGEGAASTGSTIYDGDRLSTEAGGVLRITGLGLTLQLDAQSTLLLRHPATPEGNIVAELSSATLLFSMARTGNIEVVGNDALISPTATAPTTPQIRVVNAKELRIYARRGALEFSYPD